MKLDLGVENKLNKIIKKDWHLCLEVKKFIVSETKYHQEESGDSVSINISYSYFLVLYLYI